MELKEYEFGRTSKGEVVTAITITNGKDSEFTVINRGATLTSFKLRDNKGALEECTLGFNSVKEYENHASYYGATIGRVGNRIANGSFTIDGTTYNLAQNNGKNSLHGGLVGFDKVMWNYKSFSEKNSAGVTFSYLSVDGEENYPGNLNVDVTYTLSDKNELTIDYKAITDKSTPVNLTNHAYWNLSGFKENIHNHNLQLEAETYLPTDETQIPTGEYKPVSETPYDFRVLKPVGPNIKKTGGFDHNFNLSEKKQSNATNRAYIEDPKSGRALEILTTEPGIQFYTGFDDHKFFCLETQMYPDAINNSKFDSILLKPGQVYTQKTIHKFSIK